MNLTPGHRNLHRSNKVRPGPAETEQGRSVWATQEPCVSAVKFCAYPCTACCVRAASLQGQHQLCVLNTVTVCHPTLSICQDFLLTSLCVSDICSSAAHLCLARPACELRCECGQLLLQQLGLTLKELLSVVHLGQQLAGQPRQYWHHQVHDCRVLFWFP